MARNAQTIPLRLDERVEEEAHVLRAYNNTIKGRRVDFVRRLVIVGYQTLYGESPPASLFEEGGAPSASTHVVGKEPVKQAQQPRYSKVAVEEEPVNPSVPGIKLAGMLGNQK